MVVQMSCISQSVYGLWEHVPPHAWMVASNSTAVQDDQGGEVEVCALCGQQHTATLCGDVRNAIAHICVC